MSDVLFKRLSESVKRHEDVALITIVNHPIPAYVGTKCLIDKNGILYTESELPFDLEEKIWECCLPVFMANKTKTITLCYDNIECDCYVEIFQAPAHLIVAGAGHVSEPVAEMGKMLGFYVTVIDDRREFANRDRFPNVDDVVCTAYLDFFRTVPLNPKTYILLLTRGHKFDVVSLQALLKREEQLSKDEHCSYIGMIGSRRRIAGVFAQLKDEFTEHHFTNIYSPVGLDIGAQTPAEIAVSIMAEILKIKNNKSGTSLKSKIRSYSHLKFVERKERVKNE